MGWWKQPKYTKYSLKCLKPIQLSTFGVDNTNYSSRCWYQRIVRWILSRRCFNFEVKLSHLTEYSTGQGANACEPTTGRLAPLTGWEVSVEKFGLTGIDWLMIDWYSLILIPWSKMRGLGWNERFLEWSDWSFCRNLGMMLWGSRIPWIPYGFLGCLVAKCWPNMVRSFNVWAPDQTKQIH